MESSVVCPKCHRLGDHWVTREIAANLASSSRYAPGSIVDFDYYSCETKQAVAPETILQEAQRLIYGARREDYGHPLDNFTHTAALLNAHFGDQFSRPITAEQVGELMILLKLSRQHNKPTRDNLTDIAGYAGCIEAVGDERKRRENDGRTQGQ